VRRLLPPLVLLAATIAALLAAAPARAAGSAGGVRLADPDTVRAGSGHYVTFGTDQRGRRCAGRATRLVVPYVVSTTTTSPAGTCVGGDALPGGPGDWARRDSPVWAPGVVRWQGRWLLYYAAEQHDPQHPRHRQMCLGVATSTSATGPYRHPQKALCGSHRARWSIDPDPVVVDGHLWVAYRDDDAVRGPRTALSMVEAGRRGLLIAATKRVLLTSPQVPWAAAGGQDVIENPSLFIAAGQWHLAFSGNLWNGPDYGTGIADCGTEITACTLADPTEPAFGYSRSALVPRATLPGDEPGPGGMDVFAGPDGLWATWHWWQRGRQGRTDTAVRRVVWGRLAPTDTGWTIG
jgi:arabinan endo-1,5-alpha-L-arabinosidase